jgi:ATP-dependent RNA helicase DDX3X
MNERRAGNWQAPEVDEPDPNRQWAALKRRYEWDPSYNDGVAPRDEDLEKELFGEENHVHTGINFSKYDHIKVNVKGAKIQPVQTVSITL